MSAPAIPEVTISHATDATQIPGIFRRLLHRPLAIACLCFIAFVIGIAIFAPILMPGVANEGSGDLSQILRGPSSKHLLGTDALGRDVLDRILVGTRLTMVAAAEAVLVGGVIGIPLGLAAGYLGGWFDALVAWLTDLSFTLPHLVIVLVVAAIFPRNLLAMMIAFGVLSSPGIARVVRAATLPVREELYIAAAQVAGLSRPYIIARHVLPRITGVVIVQTSLHAAGTVGITAGLAFLGILGVTQPTWGGMVQNGIAVLQEQPWLIWPPGIAIGTTVLAFILLGDAVGDAVAERWSR